MDRQVTCAAFLGAATVQPQDFPTQSPPRHRRRHGRRHQYAALAVELRQLPGYNQNPARRLVAKRGSRWELASHSLNLLELLTY
jgi:hypothetical protein